MDAANAGLLLLRVGVGVTLAAHGYFKFFKGGRLPGTARWFDGMGMRPGRVHAPLAAGTEMGAGLAFAAGLLTPLAAAGMVGLMVVAAWTVHRTNGFFIVAEGWEYNFVLALVAVSVATIGPGEWSLDDALGIATDLDGPVGFGLAAGLGLAAAVGLLAACYRPPAAES